MKNQFLPKLLLVFACFSLLATTGKAQFNQGSKTIGGGLGYSSEKQDGALHDYSYSQFNLNLSGGYLFQDNLELGAILELMSQQSEDQTPMNSSTTTSTSLVVGPYARLYNPLTEVVGLFGEASMKFGFGGGRINDNRQRNTIFEIGIRPGVNLMVNENLGLEAGIGFIGYTRNASGPVEEYSENRTVNSTFEATFDLSTIRFGLRLYLTD